MLPPKNRQYLHVPPCTLLTYHIITLYGHVLSLRYRHPGGGGGGGEGGGGESEICTCMSEGRTLHPLKCHTGLERKMAMPIPCSELDFVNEKGGEM